MRLTSSRILPKIEDTSVSVYFMTEENKKD